jgi:predicted methyltransferase
MTASRATAIAALFALIAAPAAAQTPAPIAAAIAAPDRPAADRARDGERKPAEMLAFTGVKAGDKVADFWPGGGYFTRLLAKTVGNRGKVYSVVPSEMLSRFPRASDPIRAIAAEPAYANVVAIETPSTSFAVPEALDLVWTAENYHDVYGSFGVESAARFVAAVYKALKPGGVFVVSDHVATTGSGANAPRSLHRIDPALVRAQVTAAGFVLEAESSALANASDPRTKGVFDASIRGKTDQFVMKFRKPGR